jgi:hypothetical protein
VKLNPALQTSEDIEKLFQGLDSAEPEKETKRKKLLQRILNNQNLYTSDLSSELPLLVDMPLDLRDKNVVTSVNLTQPLFGIEEPGINLIDCPGETENFELDFLAKSSVQQAQIILFLCRVRPLHFSNVSIRSEKPLTTLDF